MATDDLTSLALVVPEKRDEERAAVAAAWSALGGQVGPVGRFWDPPPLEAARTRLYGNETFCWVLAEKLALTLVSPPDDLLTQAPFELLRRRIRITSLRDASTFSFPMFVKSVVPKQFPSAVYRDASTLE